VSGGWEELLSELDDAADGGDSEWGENVRLDVGTTFTGWWRGVESWDGQYGETPVYLLRDLDGNDRFIWGGRVQLDKRISKAAPQPGDRIAIRRLEDAPAEEGRSPAWRVRVAVAPGHGSMPAGGDGEDIPF
jgi:hypothetical protein